MSAWAFAVLLALSPRQAAPMAGAEASPFGEAAAECQAHYPLKRRNLELTRDLRRRLDDEGLGKFLRTRRLAVAVVDLTDPEHIRYAGLNDDVMLYSASLPKIVSLLALAQAAKEGRVQWTPRMAARLSNMINASSNVDATWAFEQVGARYLEEIVRRPGYCFYGDTYGGLWLGRPYSKGGETHRDPLFDISHGATARQVARFYTLLERGLLVGPRGNQRILDAMHPPVHHHKFVKALEPRGVEFLARKSGTWRTFHSDSALVQHGDTRYVVVALAHHREGPALVETVARVVDDLMQDSLLRSPTASSPRP
jgi:beta-lactamase class A